MLRVIVIGVLLWLTLVLVAALAITALTAARLRTRNRVVPDVPTGAPLWWLWSPLPSARLHRRLHAAATPLHVPTPSTRRKAATAATPPTADLRRSLSHEAVRLDAHLVGLRRTSAGARRVALAHLSAQVRELEHLALRIRHLDAHAVPGEPVGLAPLAERVAHLEAAHAELDALERTAGLGPAPVPAALPADTGGHLPNHAASPAHERAAR